MAASFIISIEELSEKSQETRNKNFKIFRENHI